MKKQILLLIMIFLLGTSSFCIPGDLGLLDFDVVSDAVYSSSWNGKDEIAPSQNAVYDKIEAIDPTNSAISYPDYNEADQGLNGNSKSAKAYIDNISTDSATLVFRHNSGGATTTYTFSTDETIPSNINVIIEKGAIISIAAGVTLTINGPFDAGLYQVFSGGGSVSFGDGFVEAVYPEWWGAKSDGSTDDTDAIQAALDAVPKGGKIVFNRGSSYYAVSDTLDVDQQDDVTLEFQRGAEIKWTASGVDGISITKDHVTIAGATMEGEGTYVTSGIFSTRGAVLIFSSGDFTIIKDCHLKEPEQGGILITGNEAIIKHNTIEGGPYFADNAAIGTDRQHYGIWFRGSKNNRCNFNIVKPNSNADPGVCIQGICSAGGDNLIINSEFIGNKLTNCWDHSMYLTAARCIIANNIAIGGGLKVNMRPSETLIGNVISDNNIHLAGSSTPLCGDSGLHLRNLVRSTITGNNIYNASDSGITIQSDSPYEVIDNIISGNSIIGVRTGNSADAIGIDVGNVSAFANNIISGNIIRDTSSSAIYLHLDDTDNHCNNLISNNVFEKIDKYGMYLYHLTNAVISGNIIRDIGRATGYSGIRLKGCIRCVIANNTMYGIGTQMSYGYRESDGSDWNWLRDNLIYNAATALWYVSTLGANSKTDNNWSGS